MHTRLSDTHSQEQLEMREFFIVVDDNLRKFNSSKLMYIMCV